MTTKKTSTKTAAEGKAAELTPAIEEAHARGFEAYKAAPVAPAPSPRRA